MEQVIVDSWEEFKDRLNGLMDEGAARRKETELFVSPFLFRGQADANWRLTTTLERYKNQRFSLQKYYHIISAAKPQIETFTGMTWNVPTFPDYCKWLEGRTTLFVGEFQGYEYMVYLRHHGFPSPLLDWTRSPYVAAYFAFKDFREDAERVSLFAFWESPGGGKSGWTAEPAIQSLGPNIRSHRRHFLQQSEYTICTVPEDKTWYYACHENVFARDNSGQDLLWKFSIPSKERLKVLRLLDSYNLNSFTLFASEESLMETMALREFYFQEQKL